jgi:hypothetical protein
MDRRPLLILATLAVVVGFFAADVAAQVRFRGKATDQWGNGLEGAQVVAERDGGGGRQEATTDDDGNFQIFLAPGEYTLSVPGRRLPGRLNFADLEPARLDPAGRA